MAPQEGLGMSRVGSAQLPRLGSMNSHTELCAAWLVSLKGLQSHPSPVHGQQGYIVLVSWLHLFTYLWVVMCSHNLVETGGQFPKCRQVCSQLSPCGPWGELRLSGSAELPAECPTELCLGWRSLVTLAWGSTEDSEGGRWTQLLSPFHR